MLPLGLASKLGLGPLTKAVLIVIYLLVHLNSHLQVCGN
jgi:hypothetical protein